MRQKDLDELTMIRENHVKSEQEGFGKQIGLF